LKQQDAREITASLPATSEQEQKLARRSLQQNLSVELVGETIESVLTEALRNGRPIGGLKAITGSGWFAARPSGDKDIDKIYA
jgi:phosphoglucomutase